MPNFPLAALVLMTLTLSTFVNVSYVTADTISESIKPVLFALDTGDGSAPELLSFDSSAEGDSQATCSMTPNGNGTQPIIELPPFEAKPEEVPSYTPDMASSPYPSQFSRTPPNSRFPERSNIPNYPDTPFVNDSDNPPITSAPEPATLLIVGLGVIALAGGVSRRKR
ncbi:MAG: PEP-CTERM sorting domain-containing protein [Planctomycetaceae bacterium]|nr:PEP-CTERM sorting domain-containing protein [Planctomycetaceae bacterium]